MHTTASTLAGVEVIHAMRKQTLRNRSHFVFTVINELKQMLAA